jgi:hypothetical protein
MLCYLGRPIHVSLCRGVMYVQAVLEPPVPPMMLPVRRAKAKHTVVKLLLQDGAVCRVCMYYALRIYR